MSDYLMWFTRYGGTEVRQFDDIDDCYALAWFLEDCEACEFDQYGCLGDVEHVGVGVISDADWDAGLEAYKVNRRAQAQSERKAGAKAIGNIWIAAPNGEGGDYIGTAYSEVEFEAIKFKWSHLLGADRVRARRFENAQ